LILSQIEDLYEDFNITKLPLLEQEVRGAKKIKQFSKYLIAPFDAETDRTAFDTT